MAAIVIRGTVKATRLTGLSGLLTTACAAVARAIDYAAAGLLVCAAAAALLQLAVQVLSFTAPIAVTGITLMAAAFLHSLHRHLRIRQNRRSRTRVTR
jgi:hypothetical protein